MAFDDYSNWNWPAELTESRSDLPFDSFNLSEFGGDQDQGIPPKEGDLKSALMPVVNLTLNTLEKVMDDSNPTSGTQPSMGISMFGEMPLVGHGQVSGFSEVLLNEENEKFNILKISEGDPDPPNFQPMASTSTNGGTSSMAMMTVDPHLVQPLLQLQPPVPTQTQTSFVQVKQEPKEESEQVGLPITCEPNNEYPMVNAIRQRRKSAQAKRNAHGETVMFQEQVSMNLEKSILVHPQPQLAKSDNTALAPLNGTSGRGRRGRHNSAASSRSITPASPKCLGRNNLKGKQEQEGDKNKKKRKYEEDNDQDPSVKNAKAAKMNREKKKQQLVDLQNQVKEYEVQFRQKNNSLVMENMQLKEANQSLRTELAEEKRKNSSNSIHGVTLMDYMQGFIKVVSNTQQVILSPQLASLPMPSSEAEMQEIRRQIYERRNIASNVNGNAAFSHLTVRLGPLDREGGIPTLMFGLDNDNINEIIRNQ